MKGRAGLVALCSAQKANSPPVHVANFLQLLLLPMATFYCLLILSLVAATVLAAPEPISNYDSSPVAFDAWAVQHGKSYPTAELRAHHLANWQANVAKVNTHNAAYLNGEKTFFLAVNRLADLSHVEYKQRMLRPMPSRATAAIRTHRAEDAPVPPAQWNWIDKNVVTPIKDQVRRALQLLPRAAVTVGCRASAAPAGHSAALQRWRARTTCAT
jgi:hypothetical protein